MLKNLIDETYLKGYSSKLSDLLYTNESDWQDHKNRSTQFVFNQFIQKGYDVKKLMPELILRSPGTTLSSNSTSSAVTDTINRLRLVIDSITNTTSSKVLTLQGSNDNVTFYDIDTITIATDSKQETLTFFSTYTYYRISAEVISGSIDYRAYLIETVYDELFACKWLVFIFSDIRKAEGDQYDLRMQFYDNMYNNLMNSAMLFLDSNQDGIPDSYSKSNTLTITR